MAANNYDDIDARVSRVGGVYVSNPAVDAAMDLIALTRKDRRENGRAYTSLITGVSGMGKTSIFETYKAAQPPPPDAATMPVLLLSTASPFTPVAFWKRFLTKMEAPVPSGAPSVETLIEQVMLWLERRKVELVLLEEVSHIVDKKARARRSPTSSRT